MAKKDDVIEVEATVLETLPNELPLKYLHMI